MIKVTSTGIDFIPVSNINAGDFVVACQSYGKTTEVLDLEPLKEKWKSFGFEVTEINGHDIDKLKKNFNKFKKKKSNKPSITICHTIKGKGFYFAENNPFWHHKNNFTKEEIKNLQNCVK